MICYKTDLFIIVIVFPSREQHRTILIEVTSSPVERLVGASDVVKGFWAVLLVWSLAGFPSFSAYYPHHHYDAVKARFAQAGTF